MTAPYIICDHLRLSDLQRMDTSADTPAQAQQAAQERLQRDACGLTTEFSGADRRPLE